MSCCVLESPVGRLCLQERDDAITSISWSLVGSHAPSPLLMEACRQLNAYFDGTLTIFDLPLAPGGSEFQQRVYRAMGEIRLGQTRTYGELSAMVGGAPKAVGQACGSNPIAIVIPCHRVVASNGLGGYSGAGGVETKVELLRMEGAYSLLV